MRVALMLIGLALLVAGCYRVDDEDLRAMPVTNNPNFVPDTNIAPIQAMPY